ncbi:hypothetical protein [Streptomyces canus]|uniref:hypothetical protein n=1 Tax=Streptomyces canus TaxID=58343 RepID=UPI0030E313D1
MGGGEGEQTGAGVVGALALVLGVLSVGIRIVLGGRLLVLGGGGAGRCAGGGKGFEDAGVVGAERGQ